MFRWFTPSPIYYPGPNMHVLKTKEYIRTSIKDKNGKEDINMKCSDH